MRPARTFRICAPEPQTPLVEALLAAQGFPCRAEPFHPAARRLEAEPFPLGSSLAAAFGLIYIQDRSSMLPPALLAPAPGACCLDMCASPGGKTGLLARDAGPEGFVLATEASRDRLATLRQNLKRTGALNIATAGLEAQRLGLPEAGLDCVLLDPPCSGWGTVDKNPKVMELWTPDKAETLVRLQRELLARAALLLKPGGRLMYSTCTTNVRENEDQAAWALAELPLALDPLPAPAGFSPAPLERPGLPGVLRVGRTDAGTEEAEGQGFFLARFVKAGARPAPPPPDAGADPGGRRIAPGELRAAGPVSAEQLPPGEVRDFGGKAYFLHRQALDLLGRAFPPLRWQGAPLGGCPGGRFRPDARTRALLPPAHALPASARLDVDEPRPILDLLAGQSLELPGQEPLVGLYFRGLPLGFLSRKGRRLLWSDR